MPRSPSGFDIRDFHDLALKTGSMPRDVLDEVVRTWVRDRVQTQRAVAATLSLPCRMWLFNCTSPPRSEA